jgi:hypothetical protein
MRAFLSVMLLIALVGTFAQSSSHVSTADEIEKLNSLLKDGAVADVRMLHLHDSTMTRVNVTRDALLSMASYDVKWRDHISETFAPFFSGMLVKQENHTPDLRWGILFYDSQNHEIASVYVDKFGRYGYVDGQTVSFRNTGIRDNLAVRLHKITGITD